MACTCDLSKPQPTRLTFRSVRVPTSFGWDDERSNSVHSLGRHWTDLFVDLAALVIEREAYSPCMQLRSVSSTLSETSLPETKWLVLQPNELLIALELSLESHTFCGLRGVRFSTTMRESLWYGDCLGSHVELFDAPMNCFINGVFSTRINDAIVELGVRFELRDAHKRQRDRSGSTCPLLYVPRECGLPVGEIKRQFTASHYDLRAVSIIWASDWCAASVVCMDVLSCREYEQVKVANKHQHRQAVLRKHEDMLVLTADENEEVERITKVQVAFKKDVVVGVRFTTTRGGQGPWMGSLQQDHRVVAHEIPVDCERTLKMTGFSGAYNNQSELVSLEPVFHPIL